MRVGIQIVNGALRVNPEALHDARQLVADLRKAADDCEHSARAATPGRARRLMQNVRQCRRDATRFEAEIEQFERERR